MIKKEPKPLINPEKIFSMKGKVVVIMGGGGKMGLAFAEVLSNAGATIYLVDLNEEETIKKSLELSKKTKTKINGIGCDLSSQKNVEDCFSSVYSQEGKLDVMIYNVYSKPKGYYKDLENYTIDTWEKVMSVNVNGAFLSCKESVKIFKKNKTPGNIILTLSTYGIVSPDLRIYDNLDSNIYDANDPLTTPMAYTVSKSGLLGMVKWLAGAYGKDEIRINGLTPGGVFDGQEDSFHKAYKDKVPLGRMANWTDYNGAILFLASDASRYMTGTNLIIDGGWTVW